MLDVSLYMKFKRGPQVITPKDAALIAGLVGLQSGDRVIEAGAGSGFLTVHLASIIAPSGKLYSYDWREEFLQIAEKNLRKAGLENYVELKQKDVFKGFDEREVDLVVLDFANSDKAVAHAFVALREGGFLVGYHPNVEQVKQFVLTARETGFKHETTIECNPRELLVRPEGCRPATKGLTHTGYLSYLRRPLLSK